MRFYWLEVVFLSATLAKIKWDNELYGSDIQCFPGSIHNISCGGRGEQ